MACDKPCMLAGRSLLLPGDADRSDSVVRCVDPAAAAFFVLLLLLHHGWEGFLEQGVFRSHGLASLARAAAQNDTGGTSGNRSRCSGVFARVVCRFSRARDRGGRSALLLSL